MIQILLSLLSKSGLKSIFTKENVMDFYFNFNFLSKWIFILSCFTIFSIVVVYGIWQAGYFKRRGIKCNDDIYPFVGHMLKTMRFKEHLLDLAARTYSAFPNEKYSGVMQMTKPIIVLRDLDLIKQAGVKYFDHFVDHSLAVGEDMDSIFGNHLFALKGDKWRDMRATLSPAFTSSKMRGMFDFISETGQQMASYFIEKLQEPQNKERGLIEVEMKDAFTRYTNDVIASSAFGIEVNSFKQPDNEFHKMGKKTTDFNFIKFFLFLSFPKLMKWTKIQLMDESIKNFFRFLVLDTMKTREEQGIVRPDMIHLLQEAKKGSLKYDQQEIGDAGFATVEESHIGQKTVRRTWTDDDIVAQAVLFFIAGFDSSSTTLCFMAHELAVNPDIQNKLIEEVDLLIKEKGKKLEYNDLAKMTYMDQVVSETLRKWPSAVFTDRDCIKPFKLPPTSENEGYTIQPGEGIWIPIYGIHHDPKYFPEPEKFDPERFSEENKTKIYPMTFIPFGIGPRNCIGSRFALMIVKAVMFHLLANFTLVPTAKTQNPIKLNNKSFTILAENGFWIGLEPRI